MFNVEGQCYVTNLKEVSPKLVVGDVYSHKKVGENEYETTFIRAKFVGEGMVALYSNNIKNKDKVYIENSVLNTNKYTNKDGEQKESLELTVFKLSLLGKQETKENTSLFNR